MSIRTSITKTDVVTAAKALLAEGINPSANKIREKLKKGSFTTIQSYLDEWRQTPETVLNDVPHEVHEYLVTIATNLWQRAQEAANAAIESERAALREERTVLMKDVDKALVKAEVIQERVVEVEAELKKAQGAGARYRQELSSANNDVITLRKEAQRAEERMAELVATNDRLYIQIADIDRDLTEKTSELTEKDRTFSEIQLELAEVTATERTLRVSYEDAREQNTRDKTTLERVNQQLDSLAAVHRDTTRQRDEAVAAATAAEDDKSDALRRLELLEQRHRDTNKRYEKLNKLYTSALAKAANIDTLTEQLSEAKANINTFQLENNELQRHYAEQTGQLTALMTELRHAQRTLYRRGVDSDEE